VQRDDRAVACIVPMSWLHRDPARLAAAWHDCDPGGACLRRQTATIRAVDGVDLDIMPGETLGLVSESGCGQ
jgi:ABC-type multidrug transport system fused ATPase/permease subunit